MVQLDILQFHILQCRYLIYSNNKDDNHDHTENNSNSIYLMLNTIQTATKNNTILLIHFDKNQGDTCVAFYAIYILQRGNFASC